MGSLRSKYYSVGFLEEFIASGGTGERMPVAVGIVFLEELVEDGGYVGHWQTDGISTPYPALPSSLPSPRAQILVVRYLDLLHRA